jgi:hypothetical protein
MNIMKLQSQLQQVPDNALIGYVQNPDGQVPSYLALAELSRRKEIRKSAAPQAQAPTQSVAEQAIAEASPGIAGIPLQDPTMFSEQSMAGGGIVAFAGPEGSFVEDVYKKGVNTLKQASRISPLGPLVNAYSDLTDFSTWAPPQDIAGVIRKVGELDADYLRRVASVTGIPVSKLAEENPAKPFAGPYSPDMNPEAMAYKQAAVLKDRFAPTPVLEPRPSSDVRAPVETPAAASASSPFGAVPNITYTAMESPDAKFKDMLRTEITPQQGMAEFKNLVGENEGLAGLKTRLTGMEDKAAREEEQAPWMALARAGLSMAAGKSPNALQNIAEGAGVGLSDYTAAKERLANKEEKRFAIQTQLAQAERAEQIAAATFGENSAERIKAHNDATKLAQTQAGINIDVANANNKVKIAEADIKNELDYKQQQDTRDYQQGVLSNQKEANKIAKENKALGLDLKTAQLYKDLENQARTEVKDRVSATQAQLTDAQYDKMIQDRYLALLKQNNLTPLAGPSGWSYEGTASGKK